MLHKLFFIILLFLRRETFYYWLILVSPSRDFNLSSLIQNRSLLYIPSKRILKCGEWKGSFLIVYITELVTVVQGMSVPLLINYYYIMAYLISLLYIMINQCFRNIFYTLLIILVWKKINKKNIVGILLKLTLLPAI